MRFSTLVLAAVMVAASSGAQAQSMNAEVFYQKAMALQKKGPLALFSGDVRLLMREGKAAGEQARARRLQAAKAGQKPRYCPPAGQTSMDSNEFMQRLAAIPPAERSRIDMTEAVSRMMSIKYPCGKS